MEVLELPTREAQRIRRQVDALNHEAWNLLFVQGSDSDRALQLAYEARELADSLDYTAGLADSYRTETLARIFRSEYPDALEALWLAQQLYRDEANQEGEGFCLAAYGLVYSSTGQTARAFSYYLQAIETLENHPPTQAICFTYLGLGNLYLDRRDGTNARRYFDLALATSDCIALQGMKARVLNSLTALHLHENQFDQALNCCIESLALYQAQHNLMGISRAFHDLGRIHRLNGQPEAARHYLQEALSVRREIGYVLGLISTLIELGQLLLEQGEPAAGLALLEEALDESQRVGIVAKEAQTRQVLAKALKAEGRFAEALEQYEAFHALQLRNQQAEARSQAEYIRKSLEIEKTQREQELLRQRNLELERLNRDLEQALEMIHDSLNYARRIQNVILPPTEQLAADFADSFVFYQPREIVSGDFYWHLHHEGPHGSSIYLAVVDCTGHGVPGAFMSMLGHALLNQLVRDEGLSHPAAILEALDAHLTDVLRQRDDLSDVHDGMDASLVHFQPERNRLTFAGANLPLTRLRGGQLDEWPGSRHPLGGSQRVLRRKSFTAIHLDIEPGDQFYLYSDGFRDQFGLTDRQKRKYSRARFHTLLCRIAPLPMAEQRAALEAEFHRWRGSLRQVDDVVVLGVRC